MYPHFNRVFLPVVNKGDSIVVLLNAINYHIHFALPIAHLPDSDMINSFPVSVMHRVHLPLRREAWLEKEVVLFQPPGEE